MLFLEPVFDWELLACLKFNDQRQRAFERFLSTSFASRLRMCNLHGLGHENDEELAVQVQQAFMHRTKAEPVHSRLFARSRRHHVRKLHSLVCLR